MRRLITTCVFWLVLFSCWGQTVRSSFSPETIEIGEFSSLVIEVISNDSLEGFQHPSIANPILAWVNSSLSDDVESYSLEWTTKKDTAFFSEGKFHYRTTLFVTGYDSAMVVCPPIEIQLNDTVLTVPPALLHVTFPPIDQNIELYDINEILSPISEMDQNTYHYWIAGVLMLLLLGLLIFWFIKKRKGKSIPLDEALPLHLQTIAQLEALDHDGLSEKDLKEYYYQLSIILRRYISALLQESLVEKTTTEIGLYLKKHRLAKEILPTLNMLLNQSDMVKFAKEQPSKDAIALVNEQAKQIVLQLYDRYEANNNSSS